MTGQEIRDMDLKYNLHSWSKQKGLKPLVITKAEGIYLWDSDGKRYMDMSSGQVNSNVGHGNKDIIEAIKEQADKYCFISPSLAVEPRAKLAKMVIDRMPDNMGKVFFTNGAPTPTKTPLRWPACIRGAIRS
ncbi:aminotransferase class III-fold pyridoxal phosphate-dependent enzyme [Megasphaera sp. ASD88]|uniref:aminotransferase class III-fold pyridoxal phosphate-dependent enzyme n=1 Tax=Megasphaera sp. ASD88 TaxID=2027407 RepID=UPI002101515F|nr:aminotransferase class III-fold pyridoxal phosphate-dependent enzyme [Megasphaera sp. ASD88]